MLIFSCGSNDNNSDNSSTDDNGTSTNSFSDFYASFQEAVLNDDQTSFFAFCSLTEDYSLSEDDIIDFWDIIFDDYAKDVISSKKPNDIEEMEGQDGEIIKYINIIYDEDGDGEGATTGFDFHTRKWEIGCFINNYGRLKL
ncbi:MAG: hypothetical protein JXR68_10370 [Bacteroidales bacterium]|nr:hypothetical protein [Bacteroidales bacterium]